MTQKTINIGSAANDRQGDSLRAAFKKINDNFNELYSTLGLDGSIFNPASIDTDLIPATDNTYNIGSPSKRWKHGYFATGSLYVGDIKLSNDAGTLIVQQVTDAGLVTEEPVPDTPGVVTTDRIVNGANTFTITALGGLELNGDPFTGSGYNQSLNINDNVQFGTIRQDNARVVGSTTNLVAGATSVIFSMPTWCSSAKLIIKVECRLDGDGTDHTQTSEATIAATYNTADDPAMSVYGVVHTSPTPLATFLVRRTGQNGSGNIEVVTTNTQTINSMYVSVHAVQFGSTFD